VTLTYITRYGVVLKGSHKHEAADILLEVAYNHSLELVTPRGIITWRARGTQSIIDLVFPLAEPHNKSVKNVYPDKT